MSPTVKARVLYSGVAGSNIGRGIDYPDKGFLWLTSVHPLNYRETFLNWATKASFRIHCNSFTLYYNAVIPSYVSRLTESVVKCYTKNKQKMLILWVPRLNLTPRNDYRHQGLRKVRWGLSHPQMRGSRSTVKSIQMHKNI